MDCSRLPRFRRSSAVDPIQLTERDGNIIRLVHRYRFLRTPQILQLTGEGSQQLLRRLQLLYHHGYLERPRAQIDYYHQGGSRHMVYGLGNKGAAFLRGERTAPLGHIRWGEKNRAVGRIFLEHALLVSDVMVAMELACHKTGQIQLLTEQEITPPGAVSQQVQSFRWNVTVNNNLKLGIIPDRVFAIDYPDQRGNRERAFFFLEADRGTMPVIRANLAQTSFYRKLLAYEATWSQSVHRSRFGFHRFRVITITKSKERVKTLVDACSRLKHAHGLFLFADRTVLDEPNLISSPMWKTGRPGEVVSLLDQPAIST